MADTTHDITIEDTTYTATCTPDDVHGVDVWSLTVRGIPVRVELRRGVTTIDDLDRIVTAENLRT